MPRDYITGSRIERSRLMLCALLLSSCQPSVTRPALVGTYRANSVGVVDEIILHADGTYDCKYGVRNQPPHLHRGVWRIDQGAPTQLILEDFLCSHPIIRERSGSADLAVYSTLTGFMLERGDVSWKKQ